MAHGRTLSGLAPSTYQQVLTDYLGSGYPLGAFMPLGLGGKLAGQDIAWLFQPTIAFSGAMLALSLYAAVCPLVSSRALRALVGFLGAQPALLYVVRALERDQGARRRGDDRARLRSVAATIDRWRSPRTTLPAALAAAALLAVLSPAGARLARCSRGRRGRRPRLPRAAARPPRISSRSRRLRRPPLDPLARDRAVVHLAARAAARSRRARGRQPRPPAGRAAGVRHLAGDATSGASPHDPAATYVLIASCSSGSSQVLRSRGGGGAWGCPCTSPTGSAGPCLVLGLDTWA